MKKIILIFTLIFLNMTAVAAYEIPVDISVYGDYLKMPRCAFINDGTVYAPARAFCEALGAQVSWDAESMTVFVVTDKESLEFRTREGICLINGNVQTAQTLIVDGSTFVPVRILAETFGFSVGWDGTYFEVTIEKDGLFLTDSRIAAYSRDDVEWLAKIIRREVGSQSFECRLGVANVILNRVKSPSFPNTIFEVIFDTRYGVQFPPAHNGGLDLVPDAESVAAAKCALNGTNNVRNSLYFIESTASSSWAAQNRPYFCTIGNEMFFE